MRLVHKNDDQFTAAHYWAEGKKYEEASEYPEAIASYLKLVKKQANNPKVYERLMILYRKNKQPEKEIEIIDKAIAVFREHYTRKSPSKKITSLSSALMKATGLADKKGNSTYHPEPIAKWLKRKELLLKKKKPKKSKT